MLVLLGLDNKNYYLIKLPRVCLICNGEIFNECFIHENISVIKYERFIVIINQYFMLQSFMNSQWIR